MADLEVVEICAGAGGQALGLERAGFEHALAVELDAAACATLRANRPAWKVAEGDVADPALWRPRLLGALTGQSFCYVPDWLDCFSWPRNISRLARGRKRF